MVKVYMYVKYDEKVCNLTSSYLPLNGFFGTQKGFFRVTNYKGKKVFFNNVKQFIICIFFNYCSTLCDLMFSFH